MVELLWSASSGEGGNDEALAPAFECGTGKAKVMMVLLNDAQTRWGDSGGVSLASGRRRCS